MAKLEYVNHDDILSSRALINNADHIRVDGHKVHLLPPKQHHDDSLIVAQLTSSEVSVLKDMAKEWELLAKYNGERDYARYSLLDKLANSSAKEV